MSQPEQEIPIVIPSLENDEVVTTQVTSNVQEIIDQYSAPVEEQTNEEIAQELAFTPKAVVEAQVEETKVEEVATEIPTTPKAQDEAQTEETKVEEVATEIPTTPKAVIEAQTEEPKVEEVEEVTEIEQLPTTPKAVVEAQSDEQKVEQVEEVAKEIPTTPKAVIEAQPEEPKVEQIKEQEAPKQEEQKPKKAFQTVIIHPDPEGSDSESSINKANTPDVSQLINDLTSKAEQQQQIVKQAQAIVEAIEKSRQISNADQLSYSLVDDTVAVMQEVERTHTTNKKAIVIAALKIINPDYLDLNLVERMIDTFVKIAKNPTLVQGAKKVEQVKETVAQGCSVCKNKCSVVTTKCSIM